ncbi:hypothetical protein PCANC_26558 [Puccinia coronata f. sp. avenae]|uniref:Uncharacterized protein n=1 Tax=Puccinia coronata f. sp. avenae TaxID=200324 RepID=A0A2N5TNM5_9BASI|nr:hypothetical protein PCANC_25704 [Puccinia coronata f. sp. avenae]PLW27081.1 hypothetical protein PCANC_26558 [Puccinia coronata f. sp. avenae]
MISLLISFQIAIADGPDGSSSPSPAAGSTTSLPSSDANSTASAVGSAAANATQAAISGASTAANATASAVNSTTSAVSNAIAPLVDGSSCGTFTTHINTCLSQISSAISACSQTDDVCLCQNYANLATCYNGCESLKSQGDQYKQQSEQHCNVPGVAEKVKAAATAKNSTSTLPSSSSSGQSSNDHPSKMSAKSAASNDFHFPSLGFFTFISFALASVVF